MRIGRPIGRDVDLIRIRYAFGASITDVQLPDIIIAIQVGVRINDLKTVSRKSRLSSQSSERGTFAVYSNGPDFKLVFIGDCICDESSVWRCSGLKLQLIGASDGRAVRKGDLRPHEVPRQDDAIL